MAGNIPSPALSGLLRGRDRLCSGDCDFLVDLGGVAADADCSHDSRIDQDWNATLQWGSVGESQRRYAAISDLLLEHSTRTAIDGSRSSLSDTDVDACNLSGIHAGELDHSPRIVYDNNHDTEAALGCFGFRGSNDLSGSRESEHFLVQCQPSI